MMASTPSTAASTAGASSTAPYANVTLGSEERNLTFELRRTSATTSCPPCASCSTMCDPRNPEPPVTSTLILRSMGLQLALVNTILLVDLSAHELDADVDRSVVLHRPRQLTPFDARSLTGAIHLYVHVRRESRVLANVAVFFANAEQGQPGRLGPFHLQPPEQLGKAKGKETALEVFDELVHVGQGDRESCRLAIDRDQPGELGHEKELHVRRHLA